MKFLKLKIGQVFDYQGNRYTKSGPLQAEDMATGRERTILQAASVQPVDASALSRNEPEQTLAEELGHVRTLLDLYHQSAIALADSGSERDALETQHRALVKAIEQISPQIAPIDGAQFRRS